jgi:hypothetical protein
MGRPPDGDWFTFVASQQADNIPGFTTTTYRHRPLVELVGWLRGLVGSEGVGRPATVLAPSVPIGGHRNDERPPGVGRGAGGRI